VRISEFEEEFDVTDRAVRRLSIEEFLVDLLGGLVPGILFFCAAGAIVLPVLHATLRQFGKTNHADFEGAVLAAIAATQNTPSAIWLALSLVGLLLAYVIGHIFYRHDPNVPDRRSFKWLARHTRYRNRELVMPIATRAWKFVFKPWELDDAQLLRSELACSGVEECQFPYQYYDHYLSKRGLAHLLPWAQWTGSAEHRSKNHINRLKITLRHRCPDKCGSIIRNEAHVRLASTTWYVCGWLVAMSTLGIVWLGLLAYKPLSGLSVAIVDLSPAAAFCVGVLAPSVYARISILRFLHYQRMREIYHVLETANVALEAPPLKANASGKSAVPAAT
jgi:hypothetical protein